MDARLDHFPHFVFQVLIIMEVLALIVSSNDYHLQTCPPGINKTNEDPAYARSQLPFSQNNRKFQKLFGKFSHTRLKDSEV